MPFIAIAVALMAAFGGSVAVEHAQPGDSLYSIKSSVNTHIGTSAHGLLKTLYIESNTDADIEAEAHGNATSTAAHERNEERVDANANATVNIHSNSQGSATGTMNSASTSGQGSVKVETSGGVHVGL